MKTTKAHWKPILIDWNRKRGRQVNRAHIYQHNNIGAKLSDMMTSFVGSFPFLILHMLWFGAWIGFRVEPFPYGLLTMIVSLEAIFLSTLVMMSQNRQAERDRKRDDHEAEVVDAMPTVLSTILEVVRMVHEINLGQSEILTILKAQQPDQREELLKLVDARLRQIKAPRNRTD